MKEKPIVAKTLKVELDTQTVELSKLPLRGYADLLNALEKLPQELNKLDNASNDEVLNILPKVIANSLDEVIKVLTIATPLDEDAVGKLAIDEVIKLLQGVITVNKYAEVYEDVKKLFARPGN